MCCFTSTETVGLLGTGSQDVHLDFHTAPELCMKRNKHAKYDKFVNVAIKACYFFMFLFLVLFLLLLLLLLTSVATGVVAVVIVVLLPSLFCLLNLFSLSSVFPFSNKPLLVPGAQLCIACYRYPVNSSAPSPNNQVVLLETRSHSLSDCMLRVWFS